MASCVHFSRLHHGPINPLERLSGANDRERDREERKKERKSLMMERAVGIFLPTEDSTLYGFDMMAGYFDSWPF